MSKRITKDGHEVEAKGLTMTVSLSDEDKTKINKIRDEIRSVAAENKRLRELVYDMLRWMPCSWPCDMCERYRHLDGCEFELRMHELEVEVDG